MRGRCPGIARVSLGREARTAARGIPTFGQIANDYIAAHERSWRSDKHRWHWRQTLTNYCAPIRDLPVDKIDTEAVLTVLQQVWTRVPTTGSYLRGRIETVLDAARARGHIAADRANPARWRGHLDHLLPNPKKLGEGGGHHPAMPYADLAAFMTKLRSESGLAAKALMLIILCASRPSGVLGMTWDDVQFAAVAKHWTVPSERMKKAAEHTVPLSDAAVDLLHDQLATRRPNQTLVIPGARPGKPLSSTTELPRTQLTPSSAE